MGREEERVERERNDKVERRGRKELKLFMVLYMGRGEIN